MFSFGFRRKGAEFGLRVREIGLGVSEGRSPATPARMSSGYISYTNEVMAITMAT